MASGCQFLMTFSRARGAPSFHGVFYGGPRVAGAKCASSSHRSRETSQERQPGPGPHLRARPTLGTDGGGAPAAPGLFGWRVMNHTTCGPRKATLLLGGRRRACAPTDVHVLTPPNLRIRHLKRRRGGLKFCWSVGLSNREMILNCLVRSVSS